MSSEHAAFAAPSRLLLVDDDPLYLRTLVQMLKDEGYELGLARSGEQALELLQTTSFDCVVLDRVMPGLGGTATCRAIRADASLTALPILMLTASEEREAVLEGLDAGVDDYLTKATDVDVVRGRIRAQLRRKRSEDEGRAMRDKLHAREIEAAGESAKNRAKSAFLASMSHEIRTPMAAILGLSDLLLGGQLEDEQREYVKTIAASGDALLRLLNDILDFSRIEAGKIELESGPIDARIIVAEVLTALAVQIAGRPIEMAYRVAPDVPKRFVSDGGRVRQILVNLVGNALKFTSKGEVIVDVGIFDKETSPFISFAVRDSGIGIAATDLDKIFGSFEQAGDAAQRGPGSGLGLAISGRLAELLGGRLECESAPGLGSTFSFALPLGSSSLEAPQNKPFQGRRALVVEPHETARNFLVELLDSLGAAAHGAGNVAHALAATTSGAFDVVIAAADPASTPSLRAAANIARRAGGAPLVLLVRPGDRCEPTRLAEASAVDWLRKPIVERDLVETLSAVWRRSPVTLPAGAILEAPAAADGPVRIGSAPPTRPSVWLSPQRKLRVLLVEDHPVNMTVARRLVERLGHEVDIASDGKEAVFATATIQFDIVLMDVQMPVLDGLEATRAIRSRERATGGPRLPIIAMTANALKGDREVCLKAGMDDYLAKPVNPEALREALARWSTAHYASQTPPSRRTAIAEDKAPAFVLDAALARVNGDHELLREIAAILLDDGPRQIEELGRAATGGDVAAARRSAHALKSACATAGGLGAQAALAALERAGEENLSGAYAHTRRAWDRFADELRAWLRAG